MSKKASNAGFTLTEILIVIGIMAILLALFVSRLAGPALTRAKISKTRQLFETIRLAVRKFKTDYGTEPALTPAGVQNTIGGGKDLVTWYEGNDTLWTLQASTALHEGVKRNACLFLQLCVAEVTDDSDNKHKVGNGEPALPAEKTFAALINDSGDVIADNGGLYNVFVDAWGTPLRVSDQAVATALNGAIDESAATVTVDSTEDFDDTGSIVIDSEIITYTGRTTTTFTGCARGASGTEAAAHADGAAVTPYPRSKGTIVLESAGPDKSWDDSDDNLESNE